MKLTIKEHFHKVGGNGLLFTKGKKKSYVPFKPMIDHFPFGHFDQVSATAEWLNSELNLTKEEQQLVHAKLYTYYVEEYEKWLKGDLFYYVGDERRVDVLKNTVDKNQSLTQDTKERIKVMLSQPIYKDYANVQLPEIIIRDKNDY